MMIVVLIVIISPNKCKIGSDDHHLRMKRGFQRGLCHSCVRHEIHLIFKIFPLVIFNHDWCVQYRASFKTLSNQRYPTSVTFLIRYIPVLTILKYQFFLPQWHLLAKSLSGLFSIFTKLRLWNALSNMSNIKSIKISWNYIKMYLQTYKYFYFWNEMLLYKIWPPCLSFKNWLSEMYFLNISRSLKCKR